MSVFFFHLNLSHFLSSPQVLSILFPASTQLQQSNFRKMGRSASLTDIRRQEKWEGFSSPYHLTSANQEGRPRVKLRDISRQATQVSCPKNITTLATHIDDPIL
ncbi:hypothetical protein MKW98_030239 [Papaver atlanticum]|uniref:Uncharacterized protein n=1 Tax=Papaver atlanticum TaxID=357466 RepID=A0AAD4T1G7_9MAGN|nr:hypothetical protein MKW98_030239 [Papaver atlanticum]